VDLPDGRALAYAEFGEADAPPVLYFHGFPNCRLEPGLVPARGVRLVAVDRPGFGASDPWTGAAPRRVADWPADVARLADALGLGRFSVAAISGGVPHAAACAARLGDRVEATALVSGIAPHAPGAGGWEGRSWAGRMVRLGRRPALARLVAGGLRRALLLSSPEATARLAASVLRLPGPDGEALSGPVAAALLRCTREAQRRGVEGAVSDMAAYAAPWGFDPAGIRGPVQVWHGAEDELVPPAASRALAAAIPGAALRVVAGEGHFSLILRRHDEILGALLAARAAA
jgi:pimeloyl-ACP methyl ester carboxylesterase